MNVRWTVRQSLSLHYTSSTTTTAATVVASCVRTCVPRFHTKHKNTPISFECERVSAMWVWVRACRVTFIVHSTGKMSSQIEHEQNKEKKINVNLQIVLYLIAHLHTSCRRIESVRHARNIKHHVAVASGIIYIASNLSLSLSTSFYISLSRSYA